MTIQAMVIDTKTANKDDQGRILIHYDKKLFPQLPNVLITPMTEGKATGMARPLAITDHFDGLVAVSGAPEGSLINVVFVANGQVEIYGLPALTRQTGKTGPSALIDSYNTDGSWCSNIVTPDVRPEHMPISFVETTGITRSTDTPISRTHVQSESGDLGYILHSLSAKRGTSQKNIGTLKVEAQEEALTADQKTNRIKFKTRFDTVPVVLVTPGDEGHGFVARHPEVVTKVTQDYFEVTCDKRAPKSNFINWLAVTADLHTPPREHLDAAFDHFMDHFPEHRDQVTKHRKSLEHLILTNEDPASLGDLPFNNRPSHPKSTREEPTKFILDWAALGVDCIALIFSIIGMPVGSRASTAARAAARPFAEALQATETSALIEPELNAALRAAEQARADQLAAAKATSEVVLKVSATMWHLKVLKSVVIGLAQQFTWVEWVIAGVKLYVSIGLIIASAALTGGASVAAAGGAMVTRVIGALLAGYALEEDIRRLINDWPSEDSPGGTPAPT